MRGRAVIATALVCLSCRRADVVAKKDPTPSVDASPADKNAPAGLALLHGRLVDVKDGTVLRVLFENFPRGETVLGNRAYAVDAAGKLRVWKVPSGQEVPEESVLLYDSVARDGDRLVLTAPSMVELRDGDDRQTAFVDPKAPVDEGARLGERPVARLGSSELFWGPRYRPPGTIESVLEDRRHAIAARAEAVCVAMFDPPNHRVECVDVDAKVMRSTVVTLARKTDPSGTRFHTRFISPHHIVIGTWSFGGFKSTRRAGVVRLADGNVTIVEDELAAAVERPDGTLVGLLVMTPEVKLLSPTGATLWTHKMPSPEEFAAVTLIDDRLVIAGFNAIRTGLQVLALNVKDGKLLWTGETKLPPIGHSKYHNHVTLETLGDAVIVRGHESAVDHVHLYDSKTGALRFSDAQQ